MRKFVLLFGLTILCGFLVSPTSAQQAATSPPADQAQGPTLEEAATAIDRYVARPEPAYQWTLDEKTVQGGITIFRMTLTSQVWQDITWKHSLTVYEPANLSIQDHAILFISGGSGDGPPRIEEHLLAISIANLAGGRVAMLKHVPNQPLLDGRKEDDLITESWLRYLDTGDENWPLLFPMVKSAVKAMDAVTELGAQENWPLPIEKFVVTGASKRGWTSWLTPVVDDRVVATAPIVIDTLRFREQMRYQIESWGAFSPQIEDYTSKGLVTVGDEPETPRRAALLAMMDPWTYRNRLALPKLIVNGTNDPYWVVDAAKHYYPDLQGTKNILEIPNAGHSLDGGRSLAIAGIAALFRATAHQKTLPSVSWDFQENQEKGHRIQFHSDPPARAARLWTASSATNDFRQANWTSQTLTSEDGRFEVTVPAPEQAETRLAVFGELEFVDNSVSPPLTYSLSTIVKRFSHTEPDNGAQPNTPEPELPAASR